MLKPQNKNNRILKRECSENEKKWWELPSLRAEVKDTKERQ